LEAAGGGRLAVAGGSMTTSGWWRMTERKWWVEGNQQQRVATPPPEHEVMNKIEISRGPRGLGTQGGWQRIAIFWGLREQPKVYIFTTY
jgi:hypothetical protein